MIFLILSKNALFNIVAVLFWNIHFCHLLSFKIWFYYMIINICQFFNCNRNFNNNIFSLVYINLKCKYMYFFPHVPCNDLTLLMPLKHLVRYNKVYILFKDFIYLFFRETGREGGTFRCERNINWLPLPHTQPATWPATQACTLTRNWTGWSFDLQDDA